MFKVLQNTQQSSSLPACGCVVGVGTVNHHCEPLKDPSSIKVLYHISDVRLLTHHKDNKHFETAKSIFILNNFDGFR